MIEKDPVCGRDLDTKQALVIFDLGEKRHRYFCSEKCALIFQKTRLGL